ncbi:hyalin-like [Antedon mediterranea]|uniref:hyalin-like n=1 Tax=Antedon mediterranea TaxID=105859 RepID=UPI003AF461C6
MFDGIFVCFMILFLLQCFICSFQITDNPNPCSLNPCLNHGSCYLVYDENTYNCSCVQGFGGDRCQYQVSIKSTLSTGKPAYQSTTYSSGGTSYDASLAVNGDIDRDFNSGQCARTVGNQNPYWYVDLGMVYSISDIQVYTPYGYEVRNYGIEVYVVDSEDSPLNASNRCGFLDSKYTYYWIDFIQPSNGRFIFLFQRRSNEITVCYVNVNGIALIPIVTCPSDIVMVGTPSNVTWDPPTVIDDTDLGLIANCTPSSGSSFPSGPTTVTCTATDSDANTGACSFSVEFIAEDNEKPIVVCQDKMVLAKSSSGTYILEHDLSVTDNIDSDLSATCTPSMQYFPIGSTKVICNATDRAGNTGNCTFTVNVTWIGDPIVTCPRDIKKYSDTDQTIVTWNDTIVQDYGEADLVATCTPPSGSHFSLGSTEVACYTINTAGKTALCTFKVTVNHNENPNLVCPEDQVRVTNSNQVTVTWNDPTVSDNVDTGLSATCTPLSGSSFNAGSTDVTCSAMDTARYKGSCVLKVIVINIEAPIVTCPENIEKDSNTVKDTVTWDDPSVTDNVDTGLSATCTPPSGSSFYIGSTDVTCSAMDTTGNTGSCVFTVTINNDIEAPIVTCPKNIKENSVTDQHTVTWDDPSVTDNVDTGLSATCTPPSGSSFNIGSTAVICSAMDTAGNTESCIFSVVINNDLDAPIVTCPGNIKKNVTNQTIITWNSPLVTDNVDTDLNATCNPPSGSSWKVGSTDVTCFSKDTAGYIGICVFKVTVDDFYAPIVICPENIEEYSDTDRNQVTWNKPSVTDNVDTCLSANCTPISGSSFNIGSTDVTCSVMDTVGNTGSCTFTVQIVDSSPSVPVYLIALLVTFATIIMVMSAALFRIYHSQKNQTLDISTKMNIGNYEDINIPTGRDNAGFESYMTSTGITDDATVLQDLQHNTGGHLQETPGHTIYEVIQ